MAWAGIFRAGIGAGAGVGVGFGATMGMDLGVGSGMACRAITVSPPRNGFLGGNGTSRFAEVSPSSLAWGLGGIVFCACMMLGGSRNMRANSGPAYLIGGRVPWPWQSVPCEQRALHSWLPMLAAAFAPVSISTL